IIFFFFFTHPPTPELYTLSLHDALPISAATIDFRPRASREKQRRDLPGDDEENPGCRLPDRRGAGPSLSSRARTVAILQFPGRRSEEHTSELQSRRDLVCRLLLEKKKIK